MKRIMMFALVFFTVWTPAVVAAQNPEVVSVNNTVELEKTTAWKPVWKPDSTSEFEVGTQIRAWTIKDEGMTTILDNMQSMAGVNNH